MPALTVVKGWKSEVSSAHTSWWVLSVRTVTSAQTVLFLFAGFTLLPRVFHNKEQPGTLPPAGTHIASWSAAYPAVRRCFTPILTLLSPSYCTDSRRRDIRHRRHTGGKLLRVRAYRFCMYEQHATILPLHGFKRPVEIAC